MTERMLKGDKGVRQGRETKKMEQIQLQMTENRGKKGGKRM